MQSVRYSRALYKAKQSSLSLTILLKAAFVLKTSNFTLSSTLFVNCLVCMPTVSEQFIY